MVTWATPETLRDCAAILRAASVRYSTHPDDPPAGWAIGETWPLDVMARARRLLDVAAELERAADLGGDQ